AVARHRDRAGIRLAIEPAGPRGPGRGRAAAPEAELTGDTLSWVRVARLHAHLALLALGVVRAGVADVLGAGVDEGAGARRGVADLAAAVRLREALDAGPRGAVAEGLAVDPRAVASIGTPHAGPCFAARRLRLRAVAALQTLDAGARAFVAVGCRAVAGGAASRGPRGARIPAVSATATAVASAAAAPFAARAWRLGALERRLTAGELTLAARGEARRARRQSSPDEQIPELHDGLPPRRSP